jgi:hypothetical protein
MIPLLVTGAISIASNVADAWKAHEANIAATNVAKSGDFQKTLKAAATQLAAATQRQQQVAIPSEAQAATASVLQSPEVQALERANPGTPVTVQFNSSGDAFVSKTGGTLHQIIVPPEVQQQLQQLNSALRSPAAAAYRGMVQGTGNIYGSPQTVGVNLVAA